MKKYLQLICLSSITFWVLLFIFSILLFSKSTQPSDIQKEIVVENNDSFSGNQLKNISSNKNQSNSSSKNETKPSELKNQTQLRSIVLKSPTFQNQSFSQPKIINRIPAIDPNSEPVPIIHPDLAIIKIEKVGSFQTEINENETVFSALIKTAQKNKFTIDYEEYSGTGAFIKCLAGICGNNQFFWAFYYNGQFSNLGVSLQKVNNDDKIEFKYEKII